MIFSTGKVIRRLAEANADELSGNCFDRRSCRQYFSEFISESDSILATYTVLYNYYDTGLQVRFSVEIIASLWHTSLPKNRKKKDPMEAYYTEPQVRRLKKPNNLPTLLTKRIKC